MFHITIQHDQFRVAFKAYTPEAEAFLSDFLDHLPAGFILSDQPDVHSSITVITTDLALAVPGEVEHSVMALLRAWPKMESTWRGASLIHMRAGESAYPGNDYAYLIKHARTSKEVVPLLGHYVYYLEKRWLLQNEHFLIHASAVILHNRSFLFLGQSGAGKSTVAYLGEEVSGKIVHEDKVLVTSDGSNLYLGRMPVSGQNDPPEDKSLLTCLFAIKQDTRDYLVPMNDAEKAAVLIEGYLEVSSLLISSPDVIEHGKQVLTGVAQHIPGYELHFRKSTDFWKLIDNQFPY